MFDSSTNLHDVRFIESTDNLDSKYLNQLIDIIKAPGFDCSSDKSKLLMTLLNYKSDACRQSLIDLLEDIRANCTEHTKVDAPADAPATVFKYYTISVEEVEELIKQAKKIK